MYYVLFYRTKEIDYFFQKFLNLLKLTDNKLNAELSLKDYCVPLWQIIRYVFRRKE